LTQELKTLPMFDEEKTHECCSASEEPRNYQNPADAAWSNGQIHTPIGKIYSVSTEYTPKDLIGTIKARWGVGRMDYAVEPGIYAIGEPDAESPVLVSANYKLSFDYLRKELTGLNVWLLVLDTRGINVWCAAGKGSFGTEELVRMIDFTDLGNLVSKKILIVPQLGAPGIAAHEIRRQTGFKVIYGPVRAADIPVFISAGYKATPGMRHPDFSLADRLILTPVELTAIVKPLLILTAVLLILNIISTYLNQLPLSLPDLISRTASGILPFLIASLVGTILVPALLPYIPGRSFAWKGWLLGAVWTVLYLLFIAREINWMTIIAYLLALPAISSYLSLNFTGSTTYTSLSGVIKEMTPALPFIIISSALGLIALVTGYLI